MTPLARREARWGYLFISPWIIGFLLFTLVPMVATLGLTVLQCHPDPGAAAPVRRSRQLPASCSATGGLGIAGVTLKFALLWLPVTIIVPLGLALLLNSPRVRGAAGLRVLFFLPYVVPFVAGILIWQGMLDPQTGWVNGVLRAHRHPQPARLAARPAAGSIRASCSSASGASAPPSSSISRACGASPRSCMTRHASMVPAARATLRHVTLPMLSPVIFYTLILGVVEVMQYFLVPLVIKNGTGEPDGSTLFYNLYLYKTFFTFQSMSYGATLAWVLFLVTLAVHAHPVPDLAALRLLRRRAVGSR